MGGPLRVLGLDPGIDVTGYGVVSLAGGRVGLVEGGVLRTRRGDTLEGRLLSLFEGAEGVLDELAPSCVAVEDLYAHYDHPRAALVMGHARGALLLAAARHGLPVAGYAPSRVKKSLVGTGSATKEQVQRAIAAALGLESAPRPPDVADALAVALCHANALRHGAAAGRPGA